MDITPLSPQRLRAVKASYTTRYVAAALESSADGYHLETDRAPRAGDVVVARVTEIGKHTRLEGPASRRQLLFVGDEVLLAYGPRYAPDQFLAEVPEDLGPCDLVAAGGLAGRVVDQHAAVDDATRIEPLGLLADARGVVTLAEHAPYDATPAPRDDATPSGPDRWSSACSARR